ncbi:MAG: TRAP transporter large permease [Mailhella sp.]|nr:TRAP transporter large permease [Mailhella sp.]
MSVVFLWITVAAVLVGIPIVFGLILGPMMGFLIDGKVAFLNSSAQRIYAGIDNFPLLAIPLFVLAGDLMNRGSITTRLVAFANMLVGRLRGGLAHVNILSSIFFAGLSGSAVADVSALGSMLIPAMEKDGYTRDYASAVTAASCIIGPIIPPSIIMIVYAYVMGVSVGALFAAGFVPGVLMGLALSFVVSLQAKRLNLPKREMRQSFQEKMRITRESVLPLMTPVIILGGILSGAVTPTEAAVLAVLYAAGLSLIRRELTFSELPGILLKSGTSAATILLLVGAAAMFGWVLTVSQVPQRLGTFILSISDNPYVFLMIVNFLLFGAGMLLDAGPAILILGPIFGPTIARLGIDPVHFAAVMCINLSVGLVTPPFGLALFATSTIGKVPVNKLVRTMLPFFLAQVIVIMLVTYIPAISLTLPKLLSI